MPLEVPKTERPSADPNAIDFEAEAERGYVPRLASLEQRARRRMKRNVFWIIMGVVVFAIMAVILVRSQ